MRHRTLLAALAAAAFLAGPAAAPALAAGAAADAETSSLMLELKVKMTLLEKLGVDALRVDVASKGSRITLSGTVKKRATAELAEEVAGSVAGVRRVKSRLRVAEYQESPDKVGNAATEAEREVKDSLLEGRVRAALVDQMGRDGFRIGTDAASGIVSLEFAAGFDSARRAQAIAIAEKVPGVGRVVELAKR
jgi:hyperosmotically inducible protein